MIEQPDTSFESPKEISARPFYISFRLWRVDSGASIGIKMQNFIGHLVDCHDIGKHSINIHNNCRGAFIKRGLIDSRRHDYQSGMRDQKASCDKN